jgi:hypothetical protein|nr:MAG TPA: hypothetical protein [Caudoviricetes sp.]
MNKTELRQKEERYILDCIDNEEYDIVCNSTKEKLEFVVKVFNQEYNCISVKRTYPNVQARFEQWLRGLPSSISVEYDNYKIGEIGKIWGITNERANARFVEYWWATMSAAFFRLCDKYIVDYSYLY